MVILKYDNVEYSDINDAAIAAAAIAVAVRYTEVKCGVALPATPLVTRVEYYGIATNVVLPATPLAIYVVYCNVAADVILPATPLVKQIWHTFKPQPLVVNVSYHDNAGGVMFPTPM